MPKRKSKKNISRPWWRSGWAYWGFRLSVLAFLIPLLFIAAVSVGLFGNLPTKDELNRVSNASASMVYSSDDVLIGQYYLVNRLEVSLDEIPQQLINALIATEDVRFYQHQGLDVRSIARVFVKTLIFQSNGGGGSTLTQQLVKNLYPRLPHRFLSTLINKIKEWIVAHRIEEVYSKDQILNFYLNTVPFGENVYGIEAASMRYFGVPASDLDVQQGAVLVGMLKANHTYNPRLFPEASLKRRGVVLSQMEKYEFLAKSVADSIRELPLDLNYTRLSVDHGIAPYFLDRVRSQAEKILGDIDRPDGQTYNLLTDGLKIETSLDSRMQALAEAGMRRHMKKLQASFDQHWSAQEPWSQNPAILKTAIRGSSRYQHLAAQGNTHDQILEQMSIPGGVEAFDWEGDGSNKLSPLDSIEMSLKTLQTGFLVLDPKNGNIKVWIGGIDHEFYKYDHVKKSTKRQVGSTFKPFVYAAALEQGILPCDYIKARQETYAQYEDWTPANADSDYEGKYSMEGAMSNSVNTVTVKLIQEVGISPTIEFVRSMGIESDIPEVPSIALGTPSISLLEMVQAYSVFVNGGQKCKPTSILKITDKEGNILYEAPTDCRTTKLSPKNAKMVRRMLETVVNEGTAQRLRTRYNLKNDLAGKTGTTQNNADGWFIGMSPTLVGGAWVGADDPRIHFRTTALGQGANTALPLFAEFMTAMNADRSFDWFTKATFEPLPAELQAELECDPFQEDLNFWQSLFGKGKKEERAERKKEARQNEEPKPEEVESKEGLWKKVKGLFKKE